MFKDRWEINSAWTASEQSGKEVCFVGLGVGENYVWCLVMLVIFMGFGGAKKWRWSSYTSFYGEGGGRGVITM